MHPHDSAQAIGACAVILGFVVGSAVGQITFTDVTEKAGVALTDMLIESVAWGDYDNDGDEDVYLTGNGVNRLFRNDGDDVFTDVTEVAGVGHPAFSVGTAFGDLDNDGGAFTDIAAAAGISATGLGMGVLSLDYNNDLAFDLYWTAWPGTAPATSNALYKNLDGQTFDDVTALSQTEDAAG